MQLIAKLGAVCRWTVSYEVPEGLTALANGHELSRSPSSKAGYVNVQYATTPSMPSYLFAVVIGRLEHLSAISAAGYNVSVWSVLGKGAWLEHALEVSDSAAGDICWTDAYGCSCYKPSSKHTVRSCCMMYTDSHTGTPTSVRDPNCAGTHPPHDLLIGQRHPCMQLLMGI